MPLSDRAIDILRALPREGGDNGLIFIGSRKNGPLGREALRDVLAGLEPAVTVHGFRSSFRDWAGETTAFPADICEVALAHTIGGKTQQAYQRGDLLEKRRQLMKAWATFCYTLQRRRGANVTSIREGM